MATSDVELLLNDFKQRIGLDELSLDENGYATLGLDDLIVNLEYDDSANRLLLYSRLGDIPATGREALYERLLEANYFGQHTSGATLSINKADEAVVMVYSLALAGVSPAQFETVLENFANVAEAEQQECQPFRDAHSSEQLQQSF